MPMRSWGLNTYFHATIHGQNPGLYHASDSHENNRGKRLAQYRSLMKVGLIGWACKFRVSRVYRCVGQGIADVNRVETELTIV